MTLRLVLVLAAIAVCWAAPPGRAEEPGPAKHFLWKVTGGKGTAYLFGTIHVGNAELYPLSAVIEDSFKQSDQLVEEIDLSTGDPEAAAQQMIEAGLYPPGDSLDKHLGETTRAELAAYAKSAGLPEFYTRVKPWLVSVLVLQLQLKQLGLDKAEGLDLHFSEEAKAADKPVAALETADKQLRLFSSLSDDLQEKLLLATLLDAKKAEEMLKETLAAWRDGDAAGMERVITEDERTHPALVPLTHKLLDERNEAMARKVDEFLRTPKTYFVAVGAAHMVGPHGIIALLRDKGYAIGQE